MEEMKKVTEYRSRTLLWKSLALFLVLLLGGGVYLFIRHQNKQESFGYVTQALKKGDLVLTVFATGYIEPLESVDVGTEVSGTIEEVNVDYNDPVTKGQPLARLDDTKYRSAVDRAQASLDAAEASWENAKAQLYKAKAIIERDKTLKASTKGVLPSQSDWDRDWSDYLAAQAQVSNALAQVDQAKHALTSANYDLDRTIIYSPIDGIILVRNIDPGQTVAASFQTPVLFSIAKDLTKMELQVSIDEADIARIKKGQTANFSIDAYPDTVFKATIKKVRVNSEILEGVVTYIAVMDVDNQELLLRPGMSADADITTDTITDGFIVSRAALIYTPVQIKEKKLFAFADREQTAIDQKPHVWVRKGDAANKVYVRVLGKSGSNVAIASDLLKVDDLIILAQEKKK